MNKKLKFPVIILLLIFLIVNIQCGHKETTDGLDPAKEVKIGDHYQGGIVFYLFKPGDDGYSSHYNHGLIAATKDQAERIDWDDFTTWKYHKIYGARRTAAGSGRDNTKDIVNSIGSGEYAAKLCYDLVLDGYDDWYLPSLVELNQLYLQKDIIGGFVNDWYWSSTKRDDDTYGEAWMQDFSDGRGFFVNSNYSQDVRAIRAF